MPSVFLMRQAKRVRAGKGVRYVSGTNGTIDCLHKLSSDIKLRTFTTGRERTSRTQSISKSASNCCKYASGAIGERFDQSSPSLANPQYAFFWDTIYAVDRDNSLA